MLRLAATVPSPAILTCAALAVPLLLLCASAPLAQDLPHLWSHSFGDGDIDTGFGVATDPLGNVILVGSFAGSIDFGGGPLISAGNRDAYIAKFDAAGNHLWSARYGSIRTQHAASVATDDAGNILVTGYFAESIDFGTGPLISLGGWDIFVAKLAPDGACLWSHSYGNYADQWGVAIATDAAADVYITGHFAGAVDFGGGPLPTSGGDDIYLARLEGATGVHVWSQRFGDDRDQRARGMDVNRDGRIALAVMLEGTTDFGGGPLVANAEDASVAVFDALGTHQWSQCWGSWAPQQALEIAIDGAGSVYVTGEFEGGIDLGGGMLASAGETDIFLAAFDTAGLHRWSGSFGDAQYETPVGLALGGDGTQLLLAGNVTGTIDFGGGVLTSAGGHDVFLAAFDAGDATHRSSRLFGDALEEFAGFVSTGPGDRTYLTGHFQGTIDFGGGSLTSVGGWDTFLAAFDSGDVNQGLPVPPAGEQSGFTAEHPVVRIGPNPARGEVRISYELSRAQPVRLTVHDAEGRLLEMLQSGLQDAGFHTMTWNPHGGRSRPNAADVRYLRWQSASYSQITRLVIVRP